MREYVLTVEYRIRNANGTCVVLSDEEARDLLPQLLKALYQRDQYPSPPSLPPRRPKKKP